MTSSTRLLRRILEGGFITIGAALVLIGALVADDPSSRAGLTVIGLVVLLSTTLDLQRRFLPTERRFPKLRDEVDAFIRVVREVNAAAGAAAAGNAADAAALDAAREKLVQHALRIGDVAAAEHGVPTAHGVTHDAH
jgi:hypothetical protein